MTRQRARTADADGFALYVRVRTLLAAGLQRLPETDQPTSPRLPPLMTGQSRHAYTTNLLRLKAAGLSNPTAVAVALAARRSSAPRTRLFLATSSTKP
jgi:hypothetical protein